jgi:hypothetical protein
MKNPFPRARSWYLECLSSNLRQEEAQKQNFAERQLALQCALENIDDDENSLEKILNDLDDRPKVGVCSFYFFFLFPSFSRFGRLWMSWTK